MREEFEDFADYAEDFSVGWADAVESRPEGDVDFLKLNDPDFFATEVPPTPAVSRLRTSRRGKLSTDDVSRFQAAAEEVKRLKSTGKTSEQIMGAMGFKDTSKIALFDNILIWLPMAAYDPRAAAMANLDKKSFVTLIENGFLSINDLEGRPHELAELLDTHPSLITDVRMLLEEHEFMVAQFN